MLREEMFTSVLSKLEDTGGRIDWCSLLYINVAIRTIKRTEGISTTELVGRMLLMTKDHLKGKKDGNLSNI